MADLELARSRGARGVGARRLSPRALVPANPERFGAVGLVVVGALVWELASRADLLSQVLFPRPSETLARAWQMTVSGELPSAIGITGGRLARGLGLGGTLGLVIGAGAGWSRRFRSFTDPIVALVHPIPKLALLPFFMIVFGIGDAPRVVVIAMSSFFPMAINTMAAVRLVEPAYLEVAADHGASRRLVARRVVLPASLPHVLAGARLAFNSALHITIALELIGSGSGIGSVIWFAWETLRVEQLYAAVIVLALLGVLANYLIGRVQDRLVPWNDTENRTERSTA